MIDHVFFFVTCGLCRVAEWVCTHYMQQKRKRLFGDAENLNEKIILFSPSHFIFQACICVVEVGECAHLSLCVCRGIYLYHADLFLFVWMYVQGYIFVHADIYVCVQTQNYMLTDILMQISFSFVQIFFYFYLYRCCFLFLSVHVLSFLVSNMLSASFPHNHLSTFSLEFSSFPF